ncbi:MAG: hypothetical protein M1814_006682 [Vezdaea aestivalis]|nr:MAG: hypothetical protein M1814_006682 [Vezdaea aestivalis]
MSSAYEDDVSPPSSPETHARNHQYDWQGSPNISPVEELPETPFTQPLPRSNFSSQIPLPLRNLKPAPTVDTTSTTKPTGTQQSWYRQPLPDDRKRDTQWGDFVGQRRSTPLQSGDANQAPLTIPRKPHRKPVNTGEQSSFAQRASQAGIKGLGLDTGPRPDWKGYSGRQASVGQIPEDIRRRSPASPQSVVPAQRLSVAGSGNSGGSTPISVLHRPHPETSRIPPPTPPPHGSGQVNGAEDEHDIKPIVPLKAGRNTPPKKQSPPNSATMAPSAHQKEVNDSYNVASRGPPVQTPPTSASNARQSNPPIYGNASFDELQRREAFSLLTGRHDPKLGPTDYDQIPCELPEALKNLIPEDQPPSRFSFTTYGTSTQDESSMPSSPELTEDVVRKSAPPSPIVNRKRPVSSATSTVNTKATMRKPTPSELRVDTSPKGLMKRQPRNDAEWRDSKALPQPPVETNSADLIMNLDAQLEYLKSQRWNLSRVVEDFKRMPRFPKDRLLAKQRELDDVSKQVHETGIKLQRARRRKDRDECREPSGLWVRRITG